MTGVYTEDTLKALNKTHLIDLFLKIQDQTKFTTDFLMPETKDLNNRFERLESDVQIVKTVNNKLLKQLENTERQSCANPNIRGVSAWRLLTYLKQLSRRMEN